MNAERLLQHFDRISEAPDAIPRLRRFILDLAVRGKLVEQDPNDEPAAELLKRIQAEKARLVKEGKIKKAKAAASLSMLKTSVMFSRTTGHGANWRVVTSFQAEGRHQETTRFLGRRRSTGVRTKDVDNRELIESDTRIYFSWSRLRDVDCRSTGSGHSASGTKVGFRRTFRSQSTVSKATSIRT